MKTAREAAEAWFMAGKSEMEAFAALHDPVALARLMYVRGWISVEQLEASLEEALRRVAV